LTDWTTGNIDPADSEQLFLPSLLSDLFFCYGFAGSEALTAGCDVVFASSVCQQTEVTYPHIARGQNVKQEPSDELVCLEGHGLLAVVVGIISPQEGNIAVLDGNDAVIADRDSVGISAEVLKNTHGAIEGRLAIDDPLLMIELFPEGFEGSGFLEMADAAGEYEITRFEAVFEEVKELASEQRRHDLYVNEEVFAA
jgi:hypothetical protein